MTWHDAHDLLSTGIPGTWGSMVGATWPALARVLHPAYRVLDGEATAVRWAQLRSGLGPDTSWFDLTGSRLHSGESGPGWDSEPTVGPLDPGVTVPLLRRLGAVREARLYVGEWSGYGNAWPLGQIVEAGNREWVLTVLSGSDEIGSWLQGLPTGSVPLPSLVWPDSLRWLLNADVDLPCTVIGCDRATLADLSAAEDLECQEAALGDPIVL